MKKKSNSYVNVEFVVPIYNASVRVIVTDYIPSARAEYDRIYGESPRDDYVALCAWSSNGECALFFERKRLRKSIVAHEIFHLTHRILEWSNGCQFGESNHEQGAKLCEYLTEKVDDILKNIKLKEKL